MDESVAVGFVPRLEKAGTAERRIDALSRYGLQRPGKNRMPMVGEGDWNHPPAGREDLRNGQVDKDRSLDLGR
jgi:hypothetical protein